MLQEVRVGHQRQKRTESHNSAFRDAIISCDSEHAVEIPGVVTWY